MPITQIVQIAVESLTKFGFADAEGKYVNYSKKISDEDKLKVVPGAKFEAELYVADSGTRYLNKVFKTLQKADTVKKVTEKSTVKTEETVKPAIKAAVDSPMTKAEWSAKDRSQLIGGLSHDAAELVAAMLPMQPAESVSSVLDIYKEVLLGLLKIRDEVR